MAGDGREDEILAIERDGALDIASRQGVPFTGAGMISESGELSGVDRVVSARIVVQDLRLPRSDSQALIELGLSARGELSVTPPTRGDSFKRTPAAPASARTIPKRTRGNTSRDRRTDRNGSNARPPKA
jgi:hypothetical protein